MIIKLLIAGEMVVLGLVKYGPSESLHSSDSAGIWRFLVRVHSVFEATCVQIRLVYIFFVGHMESLHGKVGVCSLKIVQLFADLPLE